jgi:AcrR family transcriptional regulator
MSTRQTPRSRRGQRPPRDRHVEILDAAIELFLSNGFDQTSMDAIAAHAGVSKTTVYAHYEDKLALFRAVVERSAKNLAVGVDETLLAESHDARERLTHIVLTVLEATTKTEFLAFLRVMVAETARHPDLIEATQSTASIDLLAIIASILEEEATAHGYTLSEPRAFATLLLRMAVSGPQLDSLVFPAFRPSKKVLAEHARWVTEIFLRGIQPREDGTGTVVAPAMLSSAYPWLPDTVGDAGRKRAKRRA